YPTDFTRDIVPKPIHSHNDYWRNPPFYHALSHGATSIEADVYLDGSTLYVGHHPHSLSSSRTLKSLYVLPIITTLHKQNPAPVFPFSYQNGVFDMDPTQTLYLFIDFKVLPEQGEKHVQDTWDAVVKALEPLRRGDWVSYVRNDTLINRPVTIIGTGATPLKNVREMEPRYIFLDAQLSDPGDVGPLEALFASTNLVSAVGEIKPSGLDERQLRIIRKQIARAHERGIQTRYWNLPEWPIRMRDKVWRALVEEGVDLLSVNDVRAAAEGAW
ncbi:hypothetical protein M011DRAFT_378379, partial [Sporormia fimetaria CBS 119925]